MWAARCGLAVILPQRTFNLLFTLALSLQFSRPPSVALAGSASSTHQPCFVRLHKRNLRRCLQQQAQTTTSCNSGPMQPVPAEACQPGTEPSASTSHDQAPAAGVYRGRLAPSPTGLMHMGHAKTFWWAYRRAKDARGKLVMRNDDLDVGRIRPEFVQGFLEDMGWFGMQWDEGPDVGGPHGPYSQSERLHLYRQAFEKLRDGGFLFACTCSRRGIMAALGAPHQGTEEPVYPGTCRHNTWQGRAAATAAETSGAVASTTSAIANGTQAGHAAVKDSGSEAEGAGAKGEDPEGGNGRRATSVGGKRQSPGQGQGPQQKRRSPGDQQQQVTWRFRVPDGETITFIDGHYGPQSLVAGKDFGDFMVWRGDSTPSYQLACAVDDAAMGITEVVRGADLITSTARQLLILRALGLPEPKYFHTPLVTDENGVRLAKRTDALSLRALRAQGATPEGLREGWTAPPDYAAPTETDS